MAYSGLFDHTLCGYRTPARPRSRLTKRDTTLFLRDELVRIKTHVDSIDADEPSVPFRRIFWDAPEGRWPTLD